MSNRRPAMRRLFHVVACAAASLAIACAPFGVAPPAPPIPGAQGGVAPSMTIDAGSAETARTHLSGKIVSDYSRTLLSAVTRWQDPHDQGPGAAAQRRLMALGNAVDPDWAATGVDLRAAPFNIPAADRATNGFALRNAIGALPKRVFVLTQQGRFFDLDPGNPTVGYAVNNLPGQFSKTYVTLSPDGSVAFVVSDGGTLYAINVANTVAGAPPTHSVKSLPLAGGTTCRGAAAFIDPLAANLATGACTLYVVDNGGGAHRLTWATGPGGMSEAKFAASTLAEPWAKVNLPATAPATAATAFDLGDLVKAPPVVLKNKLVIGDRAGNVIVYQYAGATGSAGAKTAYTVNYGWPIETACAVDVDDNLDVTDIFAAAGAQLFWVKPATATVYAGQYALVENGGNDAIVHANNFTTYVNTTLAQIKATTPYTAFSSAVGPDDAAKLPGSASNLDTNLVSHSGFLAGLAPTINAFAGALNRKFYYYYPWDVATSNPVLIDTAPTNYSPPGPNATHQVSFPITDGTPVNAAQLLSPSAIEFDDEGSYFVADTNHCQVLYTPANATAWQRWFPTNPGQGVTAAYDAMADAGNRFSWIAGAVNRPNDASSSSRFYVFAGTLYPNAPNNDAEWSGRDNSNGQGAAMRRDIGNGTQRPNVAGGRTMDPSPINVGNALDAVPPLDTAATTPYARGTAINRVQGLAVGNLGLYIANRNAFQSGGGNTTGQILFMPRNGIAAGTYFGIQNPQAGKLYVICNFVDPQGIDVWRGAGANRDIVFAPSMNGDAATDNRICKIDSTAAAGTITLANCRIAGNGTAAFAANNVPATGATLNNPYDVSLDDGGNLFIAETGGTGRLSMIAKAVTAAEGAPAGYNWGTAGTPGNLYTIHNNMTAISSVSFAANDPQVPPGQRCLYVALGATPPDVGTAPNRVVRIDQSLYYRSVAGPPLTAPAYRNTGMVAGDLIAGADAGDGGAGDAAAVRLAAPWRARGRSNPLTGNYETYICDRANNRIRVITSSAGTSSATGYLCMPWPVGVGAHWGKPIYWATLSLFSKAAAGNLTAPTVALVPPKLKNGAAWNNAILTATPGIFTPSRAPDLDLAGGLAAPMFPSTNPPWSFLNQVNGDATYPYAGGGGFDVPYQWRLPAQNLFTSATDPNYQHLRLGLKTPADANFYWFPGSGTVNAPNVISPSFYSHLPAPTANALAPRVDYRWGNRNIGPILSQPTIVYRQTGPGAYDGTRYVYLMNANAIWRYDVTSPTAFVDGTNGAQVAFAKTSQGQAAGGTIYPFGATSFQFNSTPPLVGLNGRVYAIDIKANTTTQYTYHLNEFDGDLAPTVSAMLATSTPIAANVPSSSVADNAGIFMTGDYYITEAYFGLADGKIYRVDLDSSAP